jgi:dihydrofolate reductase
MKVHDEIETLTDVYLAGGLEAGERQEIDDHAATCAACARILRDAQAFHGWVKNEDGSFDFLDEGGGEPHGYDEFIASVDTLVIGRNTYETVLAFTTWPYGDKRVVVLSSRPLDLAAAKGPVEQMAGPPAEIVTRLAATGSTHAYVDGGITIQRFLRAGLIQRLIITRVPVLIGEGIPLFGALPHDVRLRHVATRQFASGLVQSEYAVEG